LRHPVVHFVLGGLALFLLDLGTRGPSRAAPADRLRGPIVLSAERLAQLRAEYTRDTGLTPSAADEAALLARVVEEEVLVREALARGLDRHDKSIRFRLVQKMEFLAGGERDEEALHRQALELDLGRDDVVIRRILVHKMRLLLQIAAEAGEPTDAELQAYLEAHRDQYTHPARVTLWHVFLSAQARGPALDADAARVLRTLRERAVPAAQADAHGDRFPLGHRFLRESPPGLEKVFGPAFAAAVFAVAPGQWSGPLRSAYGAHLVWVDALEPATLPALAAVRSQVATALRSERREAAFQAELQRLRAAYAVRLEPGTGG
jgi:hypothetical protein